MASVKQRTQIIGASQARQQALRKWQRNCSIFCMRIARIAFAAAVLLLAVNVFAQAHDFRTIAGATVDVQPVHDWFKGGCKGPRPLSGWRRIRVQGFDDDVGSWVKCMVVNEEGQGVEIILANCPSAVDRPMRNLRSAGGRHKAPPLTVAEANYATTIQLLAIHLGQKYAGLEVWDCGMGSNHH